MSVCPHDLIEKSDVLNGAGYYPVRSTETALYKCTACGLCWQMCPDSALEVYKEVKETGS
ncbi:MAG: 4Fe-4S binding protein [Candidatus Hydrogenedentes bacterium]|nr:4Fe-4S binding protein [Candidatus Hydrogenedentota bacterium]